MARTLRQRGRSQSDHGRAYLKPLSLLGWVVAAVVFVVGLGPLATHAEGPSNTPDVSECVSDALVAQCRPLREGETLTVIVDVSNGSKIAGTMAASLVEAVTVEVLTEGLQAPETNRERSRSDVKITAQVVRDLETFVWAPENPETTTTLFLRCSIADVRRDAAVAPLASVTCQMTRGRIRIEAGWMTGYQNYSAEPSVALLTGRPDADGEALQTLLQQVFRKMTYISRMTH